MNMYQGAGFAQGIAQGMQTATEGMVKADQIKQNRELVRQQAEAFQQQKLAGQTSQQMNDMKLEQMSMELQQLRREKTKDVTFNGLRGYMREGDVTHLNSAVNSDPQLKDLLTSRGITQFQDPKKYSAETLDSIGYNSGNFVIPTIVLGTDGREKIVDLYGTMLETGYANNFTQNEKSLIQSKLDAITLREAQVKDSQSMLTLETMNAYVEQYGQKDGMMKYYEDLTKAKEKPLTEADKVRLQTEETKLKTAEVDYQKAGLEKQKMGLDIEGKKIENVGKTLDVETRKLDKVDTQLATAAKGESLVSNIDIADKALKNVDNLFDMDFINKFASTSSLAAGTTPYKLEQDLQTLKNTIALARVGELKGSISNADMAILQNTMNSLDIGIGKKDLKENLLKVKEVLQKEVVRNKIKQQLLKYKGSMQQEQQKDTKPKVLNIGGRQFTVGQKVTNKNGTFLITENGPKKVN